MAEKPKFNPYGLAQVYAGYIGLTQNEGEGDDAFKSRVVGELRAQGQIIEAHEAHSGRRYDDPDQGPTGPMIGIIGAYEQALQGREPSLHDPERQIGDDIATGVVSRAREDSARRGLRNIFDELGSEAGMDFINATRSGDKPKE